MRVIEYGLSRRSDLWLLHIALAVFVMVAFVQAFAHTPWRDEAQAWLLARDLSPWGLFLEARHDGHPIVWHLCLKALQTIGIPWPGMEALNAAFICGAAWLLFYRSGLPLLARLAFPFCPSCLLGICYYARNYAIAAFLIFLAAALYRNVARRPLLFATLLALTANTSIYGTAVFFGAAVQFMLEQACGEVPGKFSLRPLYTRYLAPNAILALGGLLVVLQLVPVPGLFPPLRAEWPALEPALSVPAGAVAHEGLLASLLRPHLWQFMVLLPAMLLLRKRTGAPRLYGMLAMWLLAAAVMAVYAPGSRHLYVLTAGAIYFLWIYYDDFELRLPRLMTFPAASPQLAGLVTGLVILLAWSCKRENLRIGLNSQWDGRNTAQAIIDRQFDTPGTMVVTTDPIKLASVLLHLGHIRDDFRPPPWPEGPGSFEDFFYGRQRKRVPTVRELEPLVREVAAAHPDKTILVIAADPHDTTASMADPAYALQEIYRSPVDPSLDDEAEWFQVYLLKRPSEVIAR